MKNIRLWKKTIDSVLNDIRSGVDPFISEHHAANEETRTVNLKITGIEETLNFRDERATKLQKDGNQKLPTSDEKIRKQDEHKENIKWTKKL
ncbi:hypothetical protein CHS0354_014529 [Potamilus streckersoni]|uniref:Uncharacterized protein n=1 Tax=Potamilus streckersoni TaxID=2493646 RepID=A0AAE0VSY1_9BIVA|nr:hypothetical protein CHS0354_014529 [Potamilus streckersoni]